MGQDEKKVEEKDKKEEKALTGLSEAEIDIFKRYGKGAYTEAIKKLEEEVKDHNGKIATLMGIKESDTGLALPTQWNLQADAMMLKQDPTL